MKTLRMDENMVESRRCGSEGTVSTPEGIVAPEVLPEKSGRLFEMGGSRMLRQ